MKNPVVKKSKPHKGVAEYSVQAQLTSNGIIEVTVKYGRVIMYRMSILKRYYTKSPLIYDRQQLMKMLLYLCNTDPLDPWLARLTDQAVDAANEVAD